MLLLQHIHTAIAGKKKNYSFSIFIGCAAVEVSLRERNKNFLEHGPSAAAAAAADGKKFQCSTYYNVSEKFSSKH